jgi:hypothetical protein
MPRVTDLVRLIAALPLAARVCTAACIPESSPQPPNRDPLARLLAAQAQCPGSAGEFRDLAERAGARLETTMVNFLGFHDPRPGAFFLFEIASGAMAGAGPSVGRGDLLFGHFLTAREPHLVLNTSGLLVEAIAWDPDKQLFNFYELVEGADRPSWHYRGDSRLILEDIELLYRQRAPGQRPFRERLRCSGCHVNGGLVQKELAAPHNDWWTTARPLPLGGLEPDPTVEKIFRGLVDADALAEVVRATSRRLSASPAYRDALRSRSMQERLRPLFCPVELNIESDVQPLDASGATVRIPAGFFADPRLATASIAIPRESYERALQRARAKLPRPPDRRDADHAWLAPVKADSDAFMTDALVEMGVIDAEFVADVLAVDFTTPLFSRSRCGLLKLVPAQGGPDFLGRFREALAGSADPAASALLKNLSDPARDARFHREQVGGYLEACRGRANQPEASNEWFDLLVQRRAEIDGLESSRHSEGRILESPGRVVFPSASLPPERLVMNPACEVGLP